jgi:hypothetical protein
MQAKHIFSIILILAGQTCALAQTSAPKPDKVSHAEPLYSDLVRDLGARKGEKEWNVGLSLEDRKDYHTVGGLVEYEFAPANRLGVEIEVPFSAHFKTEKNERQIPTSGIDGIKVATQYTFLVSKKHSLSLAAGYANDFEFRMERISGKYNWAPENVFHPFFVAAKRWGSNYHTLLYTGPSLGLDLTTKQLHPEWVINTNFHYMFTGTKNFVGLEINQHIGQSGVSLVLRPQVRVTLSKQVALGLVTGIPVLGKEEGMSMFCRLIYEPGRKGSRQ